MPDRGTIFPESRTGFPLWADFGRCVGEALRHQAVAAARHRRHAACDRFQQGVELRPVGVGVAFEEEILHRVGGDAVRVRHLDRRAMDVAGPDHALRAVHLDALVVAVSGAPRVEICTILPEAVLRRTAAVSTSPA